MQPYPVEMGTEPSALPLSLDSHATHDQLRRKTFNSIVVALHPSKSLDLEQSRQQKLPFYIT